MFKYQLYLNLMLWQFVNFMQFLYKQYCFSVYLESLICHSAMIFFPCHYGDSSQFSLFGPNNFLIS